MMINKKVFLVFLFITAISMCAGAFFEVFMEGIGKEQLMDLLSSNFSEDQSFGFIPLLKSSFFAVIKPWAFLLISPLIPLLAVTYPMICIIKGFSVGFSSTMLIEAFGTKGIFYIISTIMPQNVLQLPIFCLLSVVSMRMASIILRLYINIIKKRRNKSALQPVVRHYLFTFSITFLLLSISCLVEACLKQFLL